MFRPIGLKRFVRDEYKDELRSNYIAFFKTEHKVYKERGIVVKRKVLEFEHGYCNECPFNKFDAYCKKTGQETKLLIPDWCPLENIPQLDLQKAAIWFYEVWKLGRESSSMSDTGFMEYVTIRDKADQDFELEINKSTEKN